MIYVLDTDVFTIAQLLDSVEYRRLQERVLQLGPEDKLTTSIITYEEQTRGWLAYAAKSRDIPHQIKAYDRLKKHLRAYLRVEILDFDEPAGQVFGELRALQLRMGGSDLKIAAIALSNNAVLISRNLKDFQRVPGLSVEDWTR
jgi:tRNA(fMet)-specific endonuclease VapC